MPDDPRELLVRRMIAEGTSDDDIRATLKAFDTQQPAAPPPSGMRRALGTAADVGIGIAKGLGSSVAGIGEMAANAGLIPGATPAAFNPAMRNPAFTRAEEATTATNTPQMVGKALETVAELAVPVGQAANAVPRAARAAGKFQDVMGAARTMPIDITGPGNVALRIQQLADRGGSMPMAVRKFLHRVTDPAQPAMAYEEARDFASNISRLSADEFNRLTPVVAREVAEMRVALNKAVGDAAGKAGKGREYAQAMTEYAKAMRLRNAVDEVVSGAARAIPVAGVGAGAYWLTGKISKLLGGG